MRVIHDCISAMKIHISSETNAALAVFNCFDTKERGQVEMKVNLLFLHFVFRFEKFSWDLKQKESFALAHSKIYFNQIS